MSTTTELQELRAQVKELTSRLEKISDQAIDTAQSAADDAVDYKEMLKAKLQEKLKTAGNSAQEYVTENPWQVLIAVGVLGAAIGLIMSKKD